VIKKILWALFWALLFAFVVFYPILISMYVDLPLLIGFSGYLIILGIHRYSMRYVWLPVLYLLNLEANLSLPMLLSLLAILLFYLTFYERIRYFKRCSICVGILSVVGINLYYMFVLLGYDFMFDTTSIFVNSLLFYSVIFDLILVVLL